MPANPINRHSIDAARRRFLLGGDCNADEPVRPPWGIVDRFLELCTRCDACIDACPERILTKGGGGFPEVDFHRGECTFCRCCAAVCPEPLFDLHASRPWNAVARIADRCLPRRGVICQSCKDACPATAIAFAPARVPTPAIDLDRCTGCGACVSVCPVDAIDIVDRSVAGPA